MFTGNTDTNLKHVYDSWTFTNFTSDKLRLAKIVTALNFATLEMSLTIKTLERRKRSREYATSVKNTKISTLVVESMLEHFKKLSGANKSPITREDIGRQYRIGRQIATAIIIRGWNHVWYCTDISFNMMRDCNWKKEIVPYLITVSHKFFPQDRYEYTFLQF